MRMVIGSITAVARHWQQCKSQWPIPKPRRYTSSQTTTLHDSCQCYWININKSEVNQCSGIQKFGHGSTWLILEMQQMSEGWIRICLSFSKLSFTQKEVQGQTMQWVTSLWFPKWCGKNRGKDWAGRKSLTASPRLRWADSCFNLPFWVTYFCHVGVFLRQVTHNFWPTQNFSSFRAEN